MTKRATSAAVLSAAVAAVGCGSGASGLSKSQLVSKANAICNTYNGQIRAIPAPPNLQQNATAAAAFFDKVTPIFDTELRKFNELKAADSVRTEWNGLVSKFGQLVALVDQIRVKADKHDTSGIALLTQIQPITNTANAAATNFGAADCAK